MYRRPEAELCEARAKHLPHVREPRHSMFCQASLRIDGEGAEFAFRIRNLSASGLMGEITHPLRRGDPVVVAIRNVGERQGEVAWIDGRRFGLKFARPIDPKQARQPVGMKLLDQILLPPVRDHSRPAVRTPLRPR